ncbi:lytic transglycosylase domain-containing protein [Pararhizobium haloflavum]|uniref:lytic transglycosylase domain-containing protein n=1 Tax=Pararhizobium haloflavum TaxID=2037914 RepID=UPI000C177923|nr:lytic transglycosylase domain-containing protein [Pararhizobium haloflavum]
MPRLSTRIAIRRRDRYHRIAVLLLSGLAFTNVPHAVAMPEGLAIEHPTAFHPFADHIAEAALRFGLPEYWIAAVLRAESAGDVRATSPVGAMGLMQVMPATWGQLRARHRLGGDPYDPRDNILAGAAYLREMFDRYGNVAAMLAAYNAGPGRYDEYLTAGTPLPSETRAYVALVAPALEGKAPANAVATPPPPSPDWRDAPLFVAQIIDRRTAAGVPSNGRRPAVTATSEPAASQASEALFVPRSVDGNRP